jgi:hypothetical protein
VVFNTAATGLSSLTSNNDITGLTGLTIQISDASGTGNFAIGGSNVGLAAAGLTRRLPASRRQGSPEGIAP